MLLQRSSNLENAQSFPLLVVGLCTAFVLLFVWLSLRQFRRRAMLRAMPTTPVAGVFVGDVEIKGRATSPAPLTAYLGEQSCVRYHWSIAEHWTRQRTETSTDSKGKTTTRVVTYCGSDVVASGGEQTVLEVDDGTGRIRVQWDGAKIEEQTIFSETVDGNSPLYYGKGPDDSVFGSDGVRTFSQQGIVMGTPLYIVGYARERDDVVDVEIARGGRKGTATEGAVARVFLISTRNESAVTSGHGVAGWIFAIIGFLAVGSLLFVDSQQNGKMSGNFPWFLASGVVGYFFLFAAAWFISMFNELIDLRNRVIRASSNIDVQLKRRADLIRGLIECAIAIRDHEGRLHKAIAFLRGQSMLENRKSAHGHAQVAIPMIHAIVEGYPALKAGEVFLRLQQALSDAEQRIALARDEFNGTATGYNARIAEFPGKIVARFALMRTANFFAAESFERHVPAVRMEPS